MQPHLSAAELRDRRERMVRDQLAARGIRSSFVLDAMRRIPREFFLPPTSVQRAYEDCALPVDCGQTISQPYMVARMTELLEPAPTDRVLEVGTGTGYQTAVLAAIVAHVYTIEWHLPLMRLASQRLDRLGLTNVTFRCGDGSLGWPEQAPFDGIMVPAGAPELPRSLPEQLKVGGRLIVPVGGLEHQTLVLIRRTATGFEEQRLLECRFVKLRGDEGWRSEE